MKVALLSGVRYTDHSRTVTDQTCPTARYWEYEYQGRGLAPIEKDIALSFGSTIAEAAQAIREGEPTRLYHGGLPWSALYMGLTEAYRTRIWPKWQEQYALVATEVECELLLSPDVTYQARPDAIVKRLSDETYWYIQDKTSSLSPENFSNGWDKLAELHATAKAIEHSLGLKISGAYVQGWYKGYQKTGTLYSPLAYCWLKPGQPGVGKPQPSFEYRPGWPRVPITELDVAAWVKSLPEPVIQQQFPVTAPILIRRDLADRYLGQVLRRELDIKLMLGDVKMTEEEKRLKFPQHFSHCDEFSKYRRPCTFRDCCWAPSVQRDPIVSQMFVWREGHHAGERRQQEQI